MIYSTVNIDQFSFSVPLRLCGKVWDRENKNEKKIYLQDQDQDKTSCQKLDRDPWGFIALERGCTVTIWERAPNRGNQQLLTAQEKTQIKRSQKVGAYKCECVDQ